MICFRSEHYGKTVCLTPGDQEALLALYLRMAKRHYFTPEVTDARAINNTSTFDRIAYDVERLARHLPAFESVAGIYKNEKGV